MLAIFRDVIDLCWRLLFCGTIFRDVIHHEFCTRSAFVLQTSISHTMKISNTFAPTVLPMHKELSRVQCAFKGEQKILLVAGMGTGKTLIGPQILQQEVGGTILCSQPRRLAALQCEQSMKKLGAKVGHHVRGDRFVPKDAKIIYVTEGILLTYLLTDPFLKDFTGVFLDEVHENSKLMTLIALVVRQAALQRPQFKVVAATGTAEDIQCAEYLNFSRVDVEGEAYPIKDVVVETDEDYLKFMKDTVVKWHNSTPVEESFLVVLPGKEEIFDFLSAMDEVENVEAKPLCSNMPVHKQQQALCAPSKGKRSVILATPIAETSLTIPHMSVVFDSGRMKQYSHVKQQEDDEAVVCFVETLASHNALKQRRGRAGRVAPGTCCLFQQPGDSINRRRSKQPEWSVCDEPLAYLTLMTFGLTVQDLADSEKPPKHISDKVDATLKESELLSGALKVTTWGKKMVKLSLSPQEIKLLQQSQKHGCTRTMVGIVAFLKVSDQLFYKNLDTFCTDEEMKDIWARRRNARLPFGDIHACARLRADVLTLGVKKVANFYAANEKLLLEALHHEERIMEVFGKPDKYGVNINAAVTMSCSESLPVATRLGPDEQGFVIDGKGHKSANHLTAAEMAFLPSYLSKVPAQRVAYTKIHAAMNNGRMWLTLSGVCIIRPSEESTGDRATESQLPCLVEGECDHAAEPCSVESAFDHSAEPELSRSLESARDGAAELVLPRSVASARALVTPAAAPELPEPWIEKFLVLTKAVLQQHGPSMKISDFEWRVPKGEGDHCRPTKRSMLVSVVKEYGHHFDVTVTDDFQNAYILTLHGSAANALPPPPTTATSTPMALTPLPPPPTPAPSMPVALPPPPTPAPSRPVAATLPSKGTLSFMGQVIEHFQHQGCHAFGFDAPEKKKKYFGSHSDDVNNIKSEEHKLGDALESELGEWGSTRRVHVDGYEYFCFSNSSQNSMRLGNSIIAATAEAVGAETWSTPRPDIVKLAAELVEQGIVVLENKKPKRSSGENDVEPKAKFPKVTNGEVPYQGACHEQNCKKVGLVLRIGKKPAFCATCWSKWM